MPTKSSSITIPMRYVRDLVDVALAHGLDGNEMLARVSIEKGLLDIPSARVSLKQFSRLYTELVGALEDEALGLHGGPIRPGSVEVLCRIGMTAPTLRDCLPVLARGANALIGGFKVECVVAIDELQIVFHERQPIVDNRPLAYEIIIPTIYAVLSWLVGQRLPLVHADFPFAAPSHLFELRTLMGGELRFDQPFAALRFPKHANDLRIVRRSEDIQRVVRRAPASFIEALLVQNTLIFEVRRVLQQALPSILTLNEVADRLVMSPRTLLRKLDAANASFQAIKDDLRRDVALHLLMREPTPLKEIATRLGFSDQSTFQRAFAKWTGVPPGEYRKRTWTPG
ncbi:AraC family transcriptional regulator [Burkholderia sp. D-99]|uniref:AraC family transcriptional regulator n=1 Tax=Burkholderia sp. D-99 TaxID=2717316 RepID=UPI00141F05F9|nr:AraC family transcriptional regulator [Burkholderia sp. D-99]NHV25886.1 AraC family transcriptional regulator [Burkholderia sp. D-99]